MLAAVVVVIVNLVDHPALPHPTSALDPLAHSCLSSNLGTVEDELGQCESLSFSLRV